MSCAENIERYYEWEHPDDDPDLQHTGGSEDDDDDCMPRFNVFAQEVPKPLYEGEYSLEPIKRALEHIKDEGLLRLLSDALLLEQASDGLGAFSLEYQDVANLGHSDYCWESRVPPLAILYGWNGVEDRVFDDYREGMVQGEHTYQIFLHTFDMGRKEAIHRGASALFWVLTVLHLADKVIQGLNWDQSRDMRFHPVRETREQKNAERVRRRAEDRARPAGT